MRKAPLMRRGWRVEAQRLWQSMALHSESGDFREVRAAADGASLTPRTYANRQELLLERPMVRATL